MAAFGRLDVSSKAMKFTSLKRKRNPVPDMALGGAPCPGLDVVEKLQRRSLRGLGRFRRRLLRLARSIAGRRVRGQVTRCGRRGWPRALGRAQRRRPVRFPRRVRGGAICRSRERAAGVDGAREGRERRVTRGYVLQGRVVRGNKGRHQSSGQGARLEGGPHFDVQGVLRDATWPPGRPRSTRCYLRG